MITANVIQRVFQMRWGKNGGSCFTIDVDGKQYICTAKHVLDGFGSGKVELFHDGKWKYLDVECVGYGSNDTDICVLSSKIQLSALSLDSTADGITLGQDVFFLGFPYGIVTVMGDLNRQFPVPFVKKAILSAMLQGDQSVLLLDGHNNPGFSGGPVVFSEVGKPKNRYRVASIVSGYRFEPEPIVDKGGSKTPLTYHANTGIVVSYNIRHALDAIHANPIGCPIKQN